MNILLVGCGRMGGALCKAWVKSGYKVTVIDPYKPEISGIDYYKNVTELKGQLTGGSVFDAIILAVKPHQLSDILAQVQEQLAPDGFVLSVAAGKNIASMAAVNNNIAIIRAMPNTPCSIGQGITALVANTRTSPKNKTAATQLMEAGGAVIWLDDETQMHAVTALSGSGPAYVFHFMEALAAAGKTLGLPTEIALQLAIATTTGSATLAQQSEDTLATLRENVTSPNGTTAAGLSVLMEHLPKLMLDTLTAARNRSRELM